MAARRRDISTAVCAASSPTLWPPAGSDRQRAWSRSSVVSTPKTMGTPVSSPTCWIPRAHSAATRSKCAVSPRMTDPMQTTASTAPDIANVFAVSGSSNDPGTHTSVMSSSATLQSRKPRRTPSSSRTVTWSLKRPHTTATRKPDPSRSGCSRPAATTSRDIDRFLDLFDTETIEQMAHPLSLRAQVALVVRIRDRLERHAFDDLEPEAFEAAALRRVVGHQAHRRDAEVDEDLRADAVLPAVGGQSELQVGVDGVVALVLQSIGADLVADADAAPLVTTQVDDGAEVLLGHLLHRRRELRSAVATQRPE